MSTLLEKAREIPVMKWDKHKCSDEEMELAFAWIRGEVTVKQAKKALGMTSSASLYVWLSRTLRSAYQRTRLILR